MKIAYLVNSLGAGGAERHLVRLISGIKGKGHKSVVLVLSSRITGGAKNLAKEIRKTGTKVIYLRSFCWGTLGRWLCLYLTLRRLDPTILHSHLPRSDLAASAIKLVWPGLPWISTLHDAYTKDKYRGHWIFPWTRGAWQQGDHFIAVSNNAKQWAEKVLRMPEGKITIIYHGVRCPTSSPSKTMRIKTWRIGCLSRYEKRKGLETLIRCMNMVRQKNPSVQLILAGSDPDGYSSYLRSVIRSEGVEKQVELAGFCKEPEKFLKNLGIFVSASLSEGFGIALIEAMATGLPVVASNIYPFNHIVQNGVTGILAEPGNPASFSQALIQLLTNPMRARQMGRAGLLRCRKTFSLQKCLDQTEKVYRSVVNKKNKPIESKASQIQN